MHAFTLNKISLIIKKWNRGIWVENTVGNIQENETRIWKLAISNFIHRNPVVGP